VTGFKATVCASTGDNQHQMGEFCPIINIKNKLAKLCNVKFKNIIAA